MEQKLSAMRYIKNNKRRVSVLAVSLGLFLVLTYITNILLSCCQVSMEKLVVGNASKMQIVSLRPETLGVDPELPYEELWEQYEAKTDELTEKIKTYDGVEDAFHANWMYTYITPVIGTMSMEVMLFDSVDRVKQLNEYMGATLIEGRLPENGDEVILDKKTMLNNDFAIGDYFVEQVGGQYGKIVGVVECENYYGCGIIKENFTTGSDGIVVLSDIENIKTAILEKEGIHIVEDKDQVIDKEYAERFLDKEVTRSITTAGDLISAIVIIVLTVALFVVYSSYIRDRRNEWCLYCSIGFSRREIYFSIMRELLITFGLAISGGSVITVVMAFAMKHIIVDPNGILCNYINPDAIVTIACVLLFLLACLQIPVCLAVSKIKSIDAIEDDLY